MTYNIIYINQDGSTKTADFSTKKKAQDFINSNDIAIESVVKTTQKGDTEVTHLFDIPYFADSAESDTENSEEYLAEQEKEYLIKLDKDIPEKHYIDTDDLEVKKQRLYIHEQELEYMIPEMWDKLYNHTPFTPYDEKYLKSLYQDLFNFDRENRWIAMHVNVNYDIWMWAYDEHNLISKLIAKIFAYIEPFDYIENLIKPYTSKEETCYKEKWGMFI